MSLTVPPGASRDLVLEISAPPRRAGPADAARLWRATRARWAEAVPPLSGTPAARDAQQANVVLRGLTSSGGGMAAAATTSLPERAEKGRNYDYRYAWIRRSPWRHRGRKAGQGPVKVATPARPDLLQATHAGYGAVMLCAPGPVIGICTRRPVSSRARSVAACRARRQG